MRRSILFFLIALTIVLPFSGCQRQKQDDHNVSDSSEPSEPAILASAEDAEGVSNGLRENIDLLDNTCMGWGQGTIVDERNCPVGSNDYNRLYGGYQALFGGAESAGKRIYLTFDEGYENGYTEKILDILAEKNCKAAFFITMDYAKSQPELVRRMIDEGHIVGNHSATHPSMPSLSTADAVNEITALHNYIAEQYHYQMNLFRPPKGEFSTRTLAVAQDLGYTSVFWSFAYKDWVTDDQPQPGASLQKLTSSAHDGAIYLLHAVSSTNTQILGSFIDAMRQKGYQFSLDFDACLS